MIDARLELAPDRMSRRLGARRLATLGVFLANGVGIGAGRPLSPGSRRTSRFPTRRLASRFWLLRPARSLRCRSWVLFAHRLRSGPASIIAGFGFAAALAAIGFARSLETLSAATFLAGATHGAMDVAMNANASDIERRWGRPIMSSFHAAIQPGRRGGRGVGRVARGDWERFGVSWGPLCSRRCSSPSPLRFSRARAAVSAARRLRRPAGASCRLPRWRSCLMGTEGAVGDWSGTYLARSGVDAGRGRRRLRGLFAIDDHRQDCRRRIVAAAGPRATVGLGALIAGAGLAISAAWPGLAGGVIGFGLVGAGLANVVPVIFSVAGRVGVIACGWHRFGRDLGLRGSADRAGRHRRCRFRRRSALGDRHAGGSGAACGRVRFVRAEACG